MKKKKQQVTLLSYFGKPTEGKERVDDSRASHMLPMTSRPLCDGKNARSAIARKEQMTTVKTKLQEEKAGNGRSMKSRPDSLNEQSTTTMVVSPKVERSNSDSVVHSFNEKEELQLQDTESGNLDAVGEGNNGFVAEPNAKRLQPDVEVNIGSVNDFDCDANVDGKRGNDDSDMSSTFHSQILCDPDQKSEYELLRERNIARNHARLKALGFMVGINDHSTSEKRQRNKCDAKKKKRKAAEVISNDLHRPTRRSTRLRKSAVPSEDVLSAVYHDDNGKIRNMIASHVVEDMEEFTVSPVVDYHMGNFRKAENRQSGISDGPIQTLVPYGPRLLPPSGLNAIYSLQYFSSACGYGSGDDHIDVQAWLVGAGKSGFAALWDIRRGSSLSCHDNVIEPVISWKSHSGRWIADARFLPNDANSKTYSPNRLVTAGNDGTVCLWDLTNTSVKTGAPKLLVQTTKLLHSSGIFSMDVHVKNSTEIYVSTGSKDKTIAISALNRLNCDPLWRSDFHKSKVGSVSFTSASLNPLIASASDDGSVAIHDSRTDGMTGKSGVVAHLEGPHFRPHTAVWKPDSDAIFMTGTCR